MTQDRRTPLEQMWQRITGLSTAARVLIVILLTVAGIGVVNYSQNNVSPSDCKLFGECQLTPAEIGQIELALHKSGKHEFRVVDHSIFVASRLRDEYLDALEQEQALPVRRSKQATQDSISPFLSPSQQAELRQARKNAKIEQAISHLPYVEQAWFDMDIAPGETAFQPDRRTAIIEVQTVPSESLDSFRIQMIRRVISGYIAAIEDPNQIVVADLRAGLAFKGAEDGSIMNNGWTLKAADRQSLLERKIASAIKPFEGVSFQLDYKLVPKTAASHTPKTKLAGFRKPRSPEPPDAANDALVHYGANGKIAIETTETESIENTPLAFAPSADQDWDRHQEHVSVVVRIDESAIANNSKQKQGLLVSRLDEDDLRSRLNNIQAEIKSRIQPVLPISALNSRATVPIRFEVPDISKLATSTTSILPFELSRINFVPTILVLCLGGVLMIFASRNSNVQNPSESELPLASQTVAATAPQESDRRQNAEERLSQLIETDPEAAAQVLKGWIKDAA